jgi:hypothetical protein
VTNDIGVIKGQGKTRDLAFEDAATQCYDLRSKRQSARKAASLDEDTSLTLIDMCVNITCS